MQLKNIADLARLGLTDQEISTVLKAAKTLRRWAELWCGTEDGVVIRGDDGRPLWLPNRPGRVGPQPLRDTETPAKARISKACQRVGAEVSFEGDPRGPVVVITKGHTTIAL